MERFEAPDGSWAEPPGDLSEDPVMPPPNAEGTSGSLTGVAAVRDRHEGALMAIDGVMGVAIGRSPIGDDALVVYLRDASLQSKVPRELEGYPVQTVVTGEIVAQ